MFSPGDSICSAKLNLTRHFHSRAFQETLLIFIVLAVLWSIVSELNHTTSL